MQLTNTQLINLQNAITHLDGVMLPREIKGDVVQVFRGYDIKGLTRLTLAGNLLAIQDKLKAHDAARNAAIKSASEGTGSVEPGNVKFGELQEELRALQETAVEITLTKIKQAEFNLDKQDIPAAVLAGLMPIIES